MVVGCTERSLARAAVVSLKVFGGVDGWMLGNEEQGFNQRVKCNRC